MGRIQSVANTTEFLYSELMRRESKLFLIILPIISLFAFLILAISLELFNARNRLGGCGCDFDKTTGDFDYSEKTAFFEGREISAPLVAFMESNLNQVLGTTNSDKKWIEIDLSDQKLIAWEGKNKFLESLISSGKWARTPVGEFSIWGKYKYTKMSGGNKEDHTYYYLPNVPYTMYFYKGFGLHGTYWHNNFGEPMSHGCINLPTIVAEKIFYWSKPEIPLGKNSVLANKENPGTRILIHE